MTRDELLARALADGTALAAALETAAQAELWLAGEIASAQIVGQPLRLPPLAVGEKAAAEIPAAARAEASRGEKGSATPPETGKIAPQERPLEARLLAAIREQPTAGNIALAESLGTTAKIVFVSLISLQKQRRIRITGDGRRGDRRIDVLTPATSAKAADNALPWNDITDRAPRARPLHDVTDDLLDPGPRREAPC